MKIQYTTFVRKCKTKGVVMKAVAVINDPNARADAIN